MPKYFSPIYNVNAILKQKTITAFGKTYAFEDNVDGFSIVDVQPEIAPIDIKAYLEGNLTIISYPVASNVNKLCAYALASFPNIESVYLFKNDDLVELEQDAFFGLDNLDSVYVPDTLFDSYVATYPAYEDLFKKIISTMDLVVPTFTGVTKLTKEIFTQVVGMLESAKKNAIERVVIPAQYTELGTECFEAISQLSICNTIVLEAVTSAEADFMKGNSSISYIQIENADFSLQGVADSTGTANFKWLTPIAYMHDYIYQDYVKDYYITGYAGITNGQAMPNREEYGYWKWYSSPATTDDTYLGDSETYPTATYTGKAYAFLIIDTLKIVGTGTLTSVIVENAINSIDTEISPLSSIRRVIIGSGFTAINDNAMNVFDDYDELTDLEIIFEAEYDYGNFANKYTNFATANNKFTKIQVIRNSNYNITSYINSDYLKQFIVDGQDYEQEIGFFTLKIRFSYYEAEIIAKNITKGTAQFCNLIGRNATYKPVIYLPKLQSFVGWLNSIPKKVFFGTENCEGVIGIFNNNPPYDSPLFKGIYVPAKAMNYYKGVYYEYLSAKVIGVLDGNNVYTDKGFNYPRLSDTLTLDTTNGHLIENGVDLFAGYTATWYSDEDCTQVISDLTTITSTTTVYVKLS